ncbi:MAG: hypothetical protein JHC25_03795 [Thermodesulfobacterium sp.]|nr:hypothetical protein [Thermodesulfobacterium sp.]
MKQVQTPAQQQQAQARPQRPQAQTSQERVQRPSQAQTTQGQSQSVLEFFHAAGGNNGNGDGRYKKLVISISEKGGVILRLIEREGDGQKAIVFALNRTETISLAREVEFYLMGVVKPASNVSGRPTIVEFFHFNDQSGQYKKLSVEVFEDGGLALVLKEGEKGRLPDGIVFSLSRPEAIHMVEELKLLFQRRV